MVTGPSGVLSSRGWRTPTSSRPSTGSYTSRICSWPLVSISHCSYFGFPYLQRRLFRHGSRQHLVLQTQEVRSRLEEVQGLQQRVRIVFLQSSSCSSPIGPIVFL